MQAKIYGSSYFIRYIVTVGLSYDRVFVKDIVHQLRGDSNLDFSTFNGLWARIDQLSRFAFLLGLGGGLGMYEML